VQLNKLLIIRFSSIGDIVLTTPIIRCAKQQLKQTQIHFVTKEAFKSILSHNPNIDKLHTFKDDVSEIYDQLRDEQFDVIIDLHHNLRSLRLKNKLNVKSYSFDKLNFKKFLAVYFKQISLLPNKHIVKRYFSAIEAIGVKDDGKGLDYFIEESQEINLSEAFNESFNGKFVAIVVGGSYFTKKIPVSKLIQICEKVKLPIIITGGKEDAFIGEELKSRFPKIINACGQFTINQSASIIKQAEWVITSDTGLMHIAAAYNKKIISLWGNTIPEFGMGPYLPNKDNKILEVKNLGCRPCSKLGFQKCPKGHFKCMNDIDVSELIELSHI